MQLRHGDNLGKRFSTSTNAEGTSAMKCMHKCLWKPLSQDCPHGEVAFSTSMCIYSAKVSSPVLRMKLNFTMLEKKLVKLHYVSLLCVNDGFDFIYT